MDKKNEGNIEDEYGQELEEEKEYQHCSQVSAEEREQLIIKNKSKLEKLLSQSDIFDCLRRINTGQLKSYDSLNQPIAQTGQSIVPIDNQFRRRVINNQKDEIEDEINLANQANLCDILKIEKQPDNLVFGQLRDYQIEGLNWLYKLYQANLNGILADEMGLGKTIQSIAILALVEDLKSQEEIEARKSHHIIIVPKIVYGKWRKEIEEWSPTMRVFCFYGTSEERDQQRIILRQHKYDVIITTFEMVIREKYELQRIQYDFLILDEAQRIKNDQSVLSQVLRKFKTKHRLLLTGTPLQNNLKELWALLNFLMPKLFDSAEEFKELFQVKNDEDGTQEQIIKQIHRLLRPFMLRRLKVDVEKNLPTKKEIYLFIGLSKMQKQLYKNILTGNIDVVNGIGDKIKLLNILMQLKKVCNHPYLFDKVEPGPPFIDGDHLIDNSMKFKILDLLIPKLLNQNAKILIFSQMTRLLDILDDFLRYRGFKYCRIDGQTSANDRELRIEDFQKEDSDKQIFILSTRAGGLGINLHSANVVIVYDSDWNPQVDLQAIDRAHRIGQKREVVVYRFVTEGSVEEKIVERAARKLKVDHLIMQKGKFSHNQDKVNAQEMLQMIKYGAQEIILTEQEGQSMNANIDSIIEHSQKKTDEINEELSKLEQKFNLNNVSLTGDDEKQTNLYTFEGQDYKKKQAALLADIDFIDIGSRQKKQQNYDIDKYYREALNITTQTKEKKKLKGWKAIANGGYDHQFFDNGKLDTLEEKENNWNLYQAGPEEYLKLNSQKPPIFTKKDQTSKDTLLGLGFSNWSKKDFFTLIRTCETYGRECIDKIMQQIPSKSEEEVKKYLVAFWKKWETIDNGHKYVERIEKGEQDIERQLSIDKAIEDKFNYQIQYFKQDYPERQLNEFTLNDVTLQKNQERKNNPIQNVNFDYTDEEDKFLSMCLHKYGYGYWQLIRNEFRNSPLFKFNWVVKCRSIQDIQRRCEYLVSQFKKENQIILKIQEDKKQMLLEEQQQKNKPPIKCKKGQKPQPSKVDSSKKNNKRTIAQKKNTEEVSDRESPDSESQSDFESEQSGKKNNGKSKVNNKKRSQNEQPVVVVNKRNLKTESKIIKKEEKSKIEENKDIALGSRKSGRNVK